MLSQLNPESARREYLRIQRNALLTATQIAREKGPAKAAEFLLGHAVAASVLEDFATAESSLDPTKLKALAESLGKEIRNKL